MRHRVAGADTGWDRAEAGATRRVTDERLQRTGGRGETGEGRQQRAGQRPAAGAGGGRRDERRQMEEADTWRGSVPPRVREGTEGPEGQRRGEG